MGTYQIVTDSTADLTPELIRQLDVQVIPLCYMMGGRTYHNIPGGGEMTDREFYAKLRGGAMSTTTQINSEEFLRVFTPLLEAGQDVLYIAFSSGLSGTCQSAQLAREELQKRFPQRKMVVFDSLCASMGEGLLVYYAAKLRQEGKSLEEVLAWLQENVLRLCHWFTVDDLRQHRTIAEASAVESPIRQETIGFPAHFFARAHNFKPPGRACQPEADSPMRT